MWQLQIFVDILVLLPGKTSAELRSQIIDFFVRKHASKQHEQSNNTLRNKAKHNDVIVAMKARSQQNAAHELDRIHDRFGDGCAICTPIRFRDSIRRHTNVAAHHNTTRKTLNI